VELEGVVAATTHDIAFSGGASSIDNWQETERGDAVSAGQGGDLCVGAW
jgi:hypothetical protein